MYFYGENCKALLTEIRKKAYIKEDIPYSWIFRSLKYRTDSKSSHTDYGVNTILIKTRFWFLKKYDNLKKWYVNAKGQKWQDKAKHSEQKCSTRYLKPL